MQIFATMETIWSNNSCVSLPSTQKQWPVYFGLHWKDSCPATRARTSFDASRNLRNLGGSKMQDGYAMSTR